MVVKRVPLKKADLSKPLPRGISKAQAISSLRERIAKIRQTKSLTSSKKPGTSMVARGLVGTNFADRKISQIIEIAAGSGEHNHLARAVERIHNALVSSEVEVASMDHQALVNVVNKIRAASNPRSPKNLTLTINEQKILRQYYKASTGEELELWK